MSNPIIVEETMNAPVERVWRAITDKAVMKEWYFDVDKFKPEVGFEFSFEGGSPGGEVFTHLCKVTEAIPNKKLQYTWRYKGYEGNSIVTFELFEEGDNKTRVKLTHEGMETFPDKPDFAVKNFVAGWNEIIGKMLPEYLAKTA
jgi:uncharacterized protein YndB with AHSA1/START domain